MFIEIEGEQLVNLDLVERVEFQERYKEAKLWAGSCVIGVSKSAYRHFLALRNDPERCIPMTPEPVETK